MPRRAPPLALAAVALAAAGCGGDHARTRLERPSPSPLWQRAAPQAEGIDPRALAAASRRARTFRGVASLLVARHGRLVFERYYGSAGPRERRPVFSITKTVVSMLVGIALADGELRSVDRRLVEVLPETRRYATDARVAAITLRELLTMTAGFARAPFVRSGDPPPALVNRPLASAPGTSFRYDGGSSDLLSAVLTRTTRASAAAYARRRLFGPLGIRGIRWSEQARGISQGAYGLSLRPRELLALGQLYLDGGRWRGRRVVPAKWVRASTHRTVAVGPGLGFGYDWWILERPIRGYAALGYGGQAIVVIPRLDEVIVVTGASDDPRPRLALAHLVARASDPADAHVSLGIVIPPAPVVGAPFSLAVGVGNAGPDPTRFTLHVEVPQGLRLVGGLADETFDAAPGFEARRTLKLVAQAPGRYTVVARLVDLAAPDPQPANNEVGLGLGVHAASPAPVRFTLVPSRPRAGRRFTVSFGLRERTTGALVTPSSASCRTTIGTARAAVVARRATCVVRTPPRARGQTLRGSLRATAAGISVSRRFAVRLR